MVDRFTFLKSFADSLTELAKADEGLAKDVCWKIINYGIYGKNIETNNSIAEALFLQMKLAIDKGQDISEKRRNANQKRTNIQQTVNKKGTKKEQNLTNDEQTALKYKKENIKDKIENNLITLSKDNEEEKSSYGNEEINLCLELIKKYNNGLIDGTKQNQRRFAKHLINKLKELESIKDGRFTWNDTLEIILKIISTNKYYSSKIVSPETIYRNLSLLMGVCKKESSQQNADDVVLETL